MHNKARQSAGFVVTASPALQSQRLLAALYHQTMQVKRLLDVLDQQPALSTALLI